MKLLILSDIHDHIPHLQRLIDNPPACDVLIGCGDYCSPFVIRLLGLGFSCPIHLVWGNNVGDRASQIRNAAVFKHMVLEGEWMDREWEGRRIFVNHYPAIAQAAAAGALYDVVAYGHDHRKHLEHVGSTLLVNPGAIMGYQPGDHSFMSPTVALYDTATHQVEIREI